MRGRNLFLALSLTISTIVVLAGCGGNASPTRTTTTPTPTPSSTTPTPAPTPAPTPTPTPTPTPSSAPFQQAITQTVNGGSVGNFGMVSVSANGDVTIQVTGAQKNATYTWSFCGEPLSPCFDLGQTLMTDASGNGQLTFHFPKTGNWAGYFSGKSGTDTIDTQDAAHRSMTASLVSENGLNGAPPCTPGVKPGCNLDPAQGTVTVANNVAHIVVQGGLPNYRYEVVLMGGGVTQGVIFSDANGNVTADLPVLPGHGSTYVLGNGPAEPVATGFTVK